MTLMQNECTKIIRDKIQCYWNETLSKILFLETSKKPKNAEYYEVYLEKNFVPRKFRTKLPDNCETGTRQFSH